MGQRVVGTAGHIDHGKSALVRALTGIDPDRLKEEKRRGITIELGFADLALDADRVISFVDVPGHERFVRHMVAGAAGIDAVLLVVAADQGVQPQTLEHLEICKLLELRHGVVAITKCDLVDEDLLEVVAMEIDELLAGTFLEDVARVRVSAQTGQGLAELREALAGLLSEEDARPAGGIPRLPVDRSFVLKGFGTVVTGTLVSGRLAEGETLAILPGRHTARIRGLHTHHRKVASIEAGRRAAVNLQGLDVDDVPRGSTLAAPGLLAPTRRAWTRLRLLESAPQGSLRGGPARFHQGTCERAARYRVVGRTEDGLLRAEVYLQTPAVLVPGDRFILRRPAPVNTIGGGVVVDACPPRLRDLEPRIFETASLETPAAIGLRLQRAGDAGRVPAELARELGLAPGQVDPVLQEMCAAGTVQRAAGCVLDGEIWRRLRLSTLAALDAFHVEQPLRAGIERERLRGRVGRRIPQDVWRELLEHLAAGGELRLDSDRVARGGHTVELGPAERELAGRIERAFAEAGLQPPELDEVLAGADPAQAGPIVDWLLAQRKLQRIQDGRLFHAEALARLRDRIREHARTSKTIDVGEFKRMTGVTRKHAIPLLEQLDAERITRRRGDAREILV